MEKTKSIILENEIDLKTWLSLNKSYNSYNGVKFHLEQDKENPKIKHVIYTFNEDNKIIKETKGKSMKQSEFQQYVIEQFKEQKKFNEQQLKFNEKIWNRLDSIDNRLTLVENRLTSVENRLNLVEKRLDSVENRLTRLESFHEKDIKNMINKIRINF